MSDVDAVPAPAGVSTASCGGDLDSTEIRFRRMRCRGPSPS